VEEDFRAHFKQLKVADDSYGDHIDFEGFKVLIGRVHEQVDIVRREHVQKIIRERNVSKEQADAYADELLLLHETFSEQDEDGNGNLDHAEVSHALFSHGLMPYDSDARQKVIDLVDLAISKDGEGITFPTFLWLIRKVREQSQRMDFESLKFYFRECDKDLNGVLSFPQAAGMFQKLGLLPASRDEQDEMRNLLMKVDTDNSGDIDFEEFQGLVQQISEQIRSNTRRRENEMAKKLGFTPQQVTEFREIFYHLDGDCTGDLGIDECRKMLTLMRIDMSADDLGMLFDSIDRKGKGAIEFEDFFYFIRDVAQNCENCNAFAPKGETIVEEQCMPTQWDI
jgi:Ca2+-binding EF-hand superfamily protein